MKRLFAAVALLLCVWVPRAVHAQVPIVRNGSIDDVDPIGNCNLKPDGVSVAPNPITVGWTSATMGTPDLFRGCAPLIPLFFGVPTNLFTGTDQQDYLPDINPPYPERQAYLGFFTMKHGNTPEYREYVQNYLNVPLVEGQRYRLTMRVASLRGRTGSCFTGYKSRPRALKKIHLVFSQRAYQRDLSPTQSIFDPAAYSNAHPPQNLYQIVEIEDPQGFGNHDANAGQQWETVSVEFVCTVPGNAEYMTIGNVDANTEANSVLIDVPVFNDGNSVVTYTAIDDVKIELLESPCKGCDKYSVVATKRVEPNGRCCYDVTITNNSDCVIDRVEQRVEFLDVWYPIGAASPPLPIHPGTSRTYVFCQSASDWKRFRLVNNEGEVLCQKKLDLKCGCDCKDEIKLTLEPVESLDNKCCWKLSMKNMSNCGSQSIYGLTFEHPQIINKQGEMTPLIEGVHTNPGAAGLGGTYQFTYPVFLDPLEHVDVMKYCIDPDFTDLPITIRLKRTEDFQEQCSTLVKEFKLTCKSGPNCCAAIEFELQNKAPWWDVVPHPNCNCGGFALWIKNGTTAGCAFTSVRVTRNGTTIFTTTGNATNPTLNLQNFYAGYYCYSNVPQTFIVEFTTTDGQVCARTLVIPAAECGGGSEDPVEPFQKERSSNDNRVSPTEEILQGELLPLRDGEVLQIFNVQGVMVFSSQTSPLHDLNLEGVTRELSTGVYLCVVEGTRGTRKVRAIPVLK